MMLDRRRRWLILQRLLVVAFMVLSFTPAFAAEKPNIVLMFVDNIGYGDFGCYGNKFIRTPHIDALAAQGVRCTDFYIVSPSCMPSRGALMTGRHPVRTGLNQQVYKIDELEQRVLPLDEELFPAYLKPAGYDTACFGKWNLGFAPRHRPTERGFDEYFGNISGNCDFYTHIYSGRNDLYRGTEPVNIEGYTTDLYSQAACEFIRRHKDRPLLVYLPFNAAHYPNWKSKPPGAPAVWQAPDEFFHRYGWSPDVRDEPKRYAAVVTALDAGIGRVVDQIDELGLKENTIVIVLSDNGAFMIPGRGLECASNRPLRGGGTTLWEGGIRVPCIVRWPKRIKTGTICREPLTSMDLLPMALAASELPRPDDRVLDGLDPTATLSGQSPSPHPYLYFHYGGSHAIRSGRYKLIKAGGSQPWMLYDLRADIGETRNLARALPDVAERLQREYERWYAETNHARRK